MAHIRKPSILVVGGDSHFYYLMRRYIRMSAHRILFAHQDALEIARQEKPAAVILDVAVPGIATLKLLTQLRADPCTYNIPVILCSWFEQDNSFLEHGANAILQMPILYEDFKSALFRVGVIVDAKPVDMDPVVSDSDS